MCGGKAKPNSSGRRMKVKSAAMQKKSALPILNRNKRFYISMFLKI
jgi:hypothetical protein